MTPIGARFHRQTWYRDQVGSDAPAIARLIGQKQCRTLIIGAGLGGLSTAQSLVERGDRDVIVIEAGEPGNGASGRNGGFVFAGYSLANERLLSQLGRDRARRLHHWTRDGVRLLAERIARWQLDCRMGESGVVLADWFGDDRRLLAMRRRLAEELQFELEFLDRRQLAELVRSDRYGGGLREPDSFHFQPLAYLFGMVRQLENAGVMVYGHSPVSALSRTDDGWEARCDKGSVRAERVILTTGGYDLRLNRRLQGAIQPVGTYIVVTQPLGQRLTSRIPVPVAVYDTRFAFDYYRPLPDGRLLWGGRISMADRTPSAIERLMRRDISKVFPELAGVGFDYAWGGWMSYARHQMPILHLAPDGLGAALAFGGHGMAVTTLGGEIMAEALTGCRERLEAFQRWGAVWAGGLAGRAAVQARYWQLQLADRLRDWRGRPRRDGRFPTS